MADQRLAFVRCLEEGWSMSEACRQFAISRPTGYAILSRYAQEGVAGLSDRSRAPHHCPHAVSQEQIARILALKAKYPTWGPKKLKARLETLEPQPWPAASTIGELLKRSGLTQARRLRARGPATARQAQGQQANQLWCIDYKGQFPLANGRWCFPLTVTDRASRFIVRCQALSDVSGQNAWPYFVGAFQEYGLPAALLSDNGAPFASPTPTGLTSLSLKFIRLGIRLERIDPGKPQQNGSHERMHRTLKAEAVQPLGGSLMAQQRRFDAWRHLYNTERPHEALAMQVPASCYTPSTRSYPRRLPALEYDSSMPVVRVRGNGCVRWQGHDPYITELLAGHDIGLWPLNETEHVVYVGHQPVAVLSARTGQFLPRLRAAKLLKTLSQEDQADH